MRTRASYLAGAALSLVILGLLMVGSKRRLSSSPPFFSQSGQDQSVPLEVPIPRQIWQIFFATPGARTLDDGFVHSNDWISMAPGYMYSMIGDDEAASIVEENFKHRPEIAETYRALKNPALKSDFLRYLILLLRGGTYADVDTKPLVRPEDWIPQEQRSKARLVIAVEHDSPQNNEPESFKYPVQFCQWTIVAAPNHRALARMVDRALAGLNSLAEAQGTDLDKAVFTNYDILNTTGPIAWTEAVFQTLQEIDPKIKGYEDLAGIKTPRYYGDVVILPYESFRADYLDDWGVSLRRARRPLVRHFFNAAWKTPPES